LVLGGVGAAACGPGRTTFAQPPAGATAFDRAGTDPKALEVADAVVAAAGGADKWAAAKQIRWSESVTTGTGEPITFDEAWDRWNGRHYNKLHTASVEVITMTTLYDGTGTALSQHGHTTGRMVGADTEHALAGARDRFQFDTGVLLLAFLLEAPGTKLTLVADYTPEAGAPPADELKVVFDPKDPTRSSIYFAIVNRETHQIDRIEIVKVGDPETKRLGYKVTGWAEVGGLKLPAALQNVGLASETITFSNVSVGEPDDSLYVPVVQ
jgi:hypothetical protein